MIIWPISLILSFSLSIAQDLGEQIQEHNQSALSDISKMNNPLEQGDIDLSIKECQRCNLWKMSLAAKQFSDLKNSFSPADDCYNQIMSATSGIFITFNGQEKFITANNSEFIKSVAPPKECDRCYQIIATDSQKKLLQLSEDEFQRLSQSQKERIILKHFRDDLKLVGQQWIQASSYGEKEEKYREENLIDFAKFYAHISAQSPDHKTLKSLKERLEKEDGDSL